MIALLLLALQVTNPSGAPVTSRVALLATWIQAADAHAPNTIDAPLQVVRAMSRADIATVMEDLRSLVILLREPNTRTFEVQEGTSRTAHRIPYTARDMEMLQRLARPIRDSGDIDRPLTRGAMLHGDIARLAPPEGEPYDASVPVGPFAQTALLTDDGRRTRRLTMVSHWSAAMALLDEVRPKSALRRTPRAPAESPFVKRWYRAVLAWQVREQEFVALLFRRAGDLFPDDADIQFLIGCRHEAEASPAVQAALGSNRLFAPSIGVGSMRGELEDAEEAFRKSWPGVRTLSKREFALDACCSCWVAMRTRSPRYIALPASRKRSPWIMLPRCSSAEPSRRAETPRAPARHTVRQPRWPVPRQPLSSR